jgi:hypothetical protein
MKNLNYSKLMRWFRYKGKYTNAVKYICPMYLISILLLLQSVQYKLRTIGSVDIKWEDCVTVIICKQFKCIKLCGSG